MIYLRLQIEPVFRVPDEVTKHYEADVMVAGRAVEDGIASAAELLRDAGWHVMAVRQSAVNPVPEDLRNRPRLGRLLQQAKRDGTAYLLRYREPSDEPAPVRSQDLSSAVARK